MALYKRKIAMLYLITHQFGASAIPMQIGTRAFRPILSKFYKSIRERTDAYDCMSFLADERLFGF
jgi:hypothetical protein